MAVLTKEEALMVLKRACDYSRAKKQRRKVLHQKMVKAQAKAIASLVKQAKMEKSAAWASLIPWIMMLAKPLLRGVGSLGRRFGSTLLKRVPGRFASGLGRTIQAGQRGLGHALRGVGFSGAGGRMLQSGRNIGMASRVGRRALGSAEKLGMGSMFLPMFVPPDYLPSWLGGYEESPGMGEMAENDPMAQWQLRNKRLAEKGLWAPPPMQI